jgi:acyl carrier protein
MPSWRRERERFIGWIFEGTDAPAAIQAEMPEPPIRRSAARRFSTAQMAFASATPMPEDRAAVIADYIRAHLLVDRGKELTLDTPFITDGLVDSMGLVLLAAFVEERFGVRIDDAEIRAGHLETIREILSLVDQRG